MFSVDQSYFLNTSTKEVIKMEPYEPGWESEVAANPTARMPVDSGQNFASLAVDGVAEKGVLVDDTGNQISPGDISGTAPEEEQCSWHYTSSMGEPEDYEEITIKDEKIECFSWDDNANAKSYETHSSDSEISDQPRSPEPPENERDPTKKRKRDPSTWKSTIRKKAKNLGQEYISSRGKFVPAAKMRNPCACSMNCVHRLPEEDRQRAFDAFWGLGDRDKRWDYVRRNSAIAPTKSKSDDHVLKRTVFRNYFFTVNEQPIKVCKQMFMSTLGIWDCVIESAYSHVNEGGTVSSNKMGKHGKKIRVITEFMIASVVEHVNLFPRVPSHYYRKRSKREYLDGSLSLSAMARLYVKWAADKGLGRSAATSRQYIDILNGRFVLGFQAGKKDQCTLCHIFHVKNTTENLRRKYVAIYPAHYRKKEKAKMVKAKDVNDGVRDHSIAVLSYELQKQLPCPKSGSSCFWYKNKLNVFNLTFFNMVTRVGRCFLWHDGIGKRGSNEITSCVYHYIKYLVECGYKEIRIWSDNCAGQNKNRYLYSMYIHLAVRYSVKIIHRYLEAGHAQMGTDSIHGRIEKATKKKEIFGFEEWVEEFEMAKEKFPPYDVVRVTKSCIYSFKELVAKQNWEQDLGGKKITWKKVREVQVDGNEGSLLRIRYDLDGEMVTLSPDRVGHLVNLKTYRAPQAYTTNIPLAENTAKHIQELLDNNSIPELKQQFFRDVLARTTHTEEVVTDVEYDTEEEICSGERDL